MRRPLLVLALLAGGVLLAWLAHLGVGSEYWYRPWEVAAELLRGPGREETINSIVWDIRLPRALACLLVGGILGAVGSAFQALLRNPLADPYIVGVSSGSAVGGALAVVLGVELWAGGLGKTLLGFVSGLLALALVVALARRRGALDVGALLLAGVVVGSLLFSVLSLILLMGGKDTSVVLRWLLGDVSGKHWGEIVVLAVAMLFGTAILVPQTRRLNAYALGEEAAGRLGVDVPRLVRTVLLVGTAMTAAAVGAVGIVGFLGLVAPHVARRIVGVDWRVSLPGSLLVGALLLLAADLFAQRGLGALAGGMVTELPVGIVTALLGAPSLLILMRRDR